MKHSLLRAVCGVVTWLGAAGFCAGGDWPQWRGPERDGHAAPGPVPATLAAEPKVVWRREIGGGFSSPVVAQGQLVYLDAQAGKEVVHLADAATGRQIWAVPLADVYQDEWGPGPRSTPMLDGDRIYVQSCNGEFRCLNRADGATRWSLNFERDFGVKFLGSKANEGTASRRGNNGSGVVAGDRVFLPVGAVNGATLVCCDKLTGKEIWRAGTDEAGYSSPVVATLAGVRQVVYFDADALLGLDFATGRGLWRVPLKTNAKRHAMTPVIRGDTVTVNSHTFGMICFQITNSNGGQTATPVWTNRELKINLATPVLVDHYLFSHGEINARNLVCVDALTGKTLWKQPGLGETVSATIAVGNRLLVQSDRGELLLVAADPGQYQELGRAQVCGTTWSHPAYADGKLFVREGTLSGWKLTCFDLLDPKP